VYSSNRIGPKQLLDKGNVDDQPPFGRMAGPFVVVSSASTNAVAVKWHAGNDRGVARLDGAAARSIKQANAPWPRKFAGNGVEVIRVFKAVDSVAARGDREWCVLRTAPVTRRAGRGAREDDQ